MKKLHVLCAATIAILSTSTLFAEDKISDEKLKNKLVELLPQYTVKSVSDSNVPGLKEVVIGPDILYATADGKHLFQGNVFNIEDGLEDLTEPRKNLARKSSMDDIEEEMIIFGKKDAKDTITVFTDIDCPFCAKFHQEMDQYEAQGFRVRYLFFPRNGLRGPSYEKAISVWCADDQKSAMTTAKSGSDVPKKSCDNPIKEHYILGHQMGVTGTPSIVLDNGIMIPGYVEAPKLRKMVDSTKG